MDAYELVRPWAKLSRLKDGAVAYHPLICHMADVAAVTRALWERAIAEGARRSIAESCGLAEEDGGRWLAFWAGLHDLGKACPAFQHQDAAGDVIREHLRAVGLARPGVPVPSKDAPHGVVSAKVLVTLLVAELGVAREVATRVATAVGGHHGVLPQSKPVLDLSPYAVGDGPWDAVRRALVRRLAHLVGLPDARPQRLDNAAAMFLAGLTSVADWIASIKEQFQYAIADASLPPPDLSAYGALAEERAVAALDRLGWTGWSPATDVRPFTALFGVASPYPMQQATIDLASLLDGPSLVIIEAPMGEGKTEAAMYLADTWGIERGQRGCYFALPTQATSNQMYDRVREFLRQRYPGQVVNAQLVHGHAALAAEIEVLAEGAHQAIEVSNIHGDAGGSALASVAAAEWFTRRKRGLLAPFGVGTVDQALLAALQTRHVFVRLFGLAQKTVIVDEVHAYDTYMSALLERLLAWLAALGTSVVLLSATLPDARRRALAAAYAGGLGESPALPAARYPRLTWLARGQAGTREVAAAPRSVRALRLLPIDGTLPAEEGAPFALGDRLRGALGGGGCAAVICNTVNRAQDTYLALKRAFAEDISAGTLDLDLFHARYVFEARQRREDRTLRRFGKSADGERPARAILVSTQVIEQSLDLDFDLMVSDFAPADLVLQRAGRLHRHDDRARPAMLAEPELRLCVPVEGDDGVPRFDAGSAAVYDAHILLRSWLTLRGREAIHIPDDVADLIEEVYAERACPADASPALRDLWQKTWEDHRKQVAHEEREARERWIRLPTFAGPLWRLSDDPREEDAPDFHKEHQALTRLAEPSVQVVILWGSQERPTLDAAGREAVDLRAKPTVALAKRLLERSVAISRRRVTQTLLDLAPPPGWRASPLLRHHRLLILDAAGGADVGKYRLKLDDELGVVIVEA